MGIFKHVPRKYADRFESGSAIQIGTAEHYREMSWDRADPYEGQTALYQTPGTSPSLVNWNANPEIARLVGGAENLHSGITFEDNVFGFDVRPMYLFCCSLEPNLSRDEAIFEITDPIEFARSIAATRPDLLGTSASGAVCYESRVGVAFQSQFLPPDPFIKHTNMDWEKEFRFKWDALKPDEATVLITAPEAARVIRKLDH